MPLHLAFIWALRLDLGTSRSSEHITDCCVSLATHPYLDEQYYNLHSNKIILNYKDLIEMSITKKSFAHSFMMNIYSSQTQFVITHVINSISVTSIPTSQDKEINNQNV